MLTKQSIYTRNKTYNALKCMKRVHGNAYVV